MGSYDGRERCHNCGLLHDRSLSVCPRCGARSKHHPILSWMFRGFAAVIVLMVLVSMATAQRESAANGSANVPKAAVSESITGAKAITKEDVEEQAVDAGYKDLLRNPEDYKGGYVVLTVRVNQVESASYFAISTEGNSGVYAYGDVYCLLDKRVDDNTKILDNDILKIYGKFSELQHFTSKKDNTETIEAPVIEMLYVEIIDG